MLLACQNDMMKLAFHCQTNSFIKSHLMKQGFIHQFQIIKCILMVMILSEKIDQEVEVVFACICVAPLIIGSGMI